MNKIQQNFLSNLQIREQYFNTSKTAGADKGKEAQGVSFQDILAQKSLDAAKGAPLKFSKHASNRLADRNIELTKEQVNRLNLGAAKASAKGINESLVLVDSLAFIVNVPNQTVITAMNQTETDENVFTNIDGAVII